MPRITATATDLQADLWRTTNRTQAVDGRQPVGSARGRPRAAAQDRQLGRARVPMPVEDRGDLARRLLCGHVRDGAAQPLPDDRPTPLPAAEDLGHPGDHSNPRRDQRGTAMWAAGRRPASGCRSAGCSQLITPKHHQPDQPHDRGQPEQPLQRPGGPPPQRVLARSGVVTASSPAARRGGPSVGAAASSRPPPTAPAGRRRPAPCQVTPRAASLTAERAEAVGAGIDDRPTISRTSESTCSSTWDGTRSSRSRRSGSGRSFRPTG